jgi:hypothetical protein
MEWFPTSIYASEALFAYVILGGGLAEELRAIRPLDRSAQAVIRSARKSKPPKQVSERNGGECASRNSTIRFENVLAREPERFRSEHLKPELASHARSLD